MFTKKHFIQIAQVLKNQRLAIQNSDNKDFKILISNIENELINLFIEDNGKFNIQRFRNASNLTTEEKGLAIWVK